MYDVVLERLIVNSPMLEMANLVPGDTGLKATIWFGKIGGQHGPRIKVSNIIDTFSESDSFVVSISSEPKILTPKHMKLKPQEVSSVLSWVKLNHSTLTEMFRLAENNQSYLYLFSQLKKV